MADICDASFLSQQSYGNIVYVCTCWAGEDQTTGFLKRMIGVVILQNTIDGKTMFHEFPAGISIRIPAGCIGWAVSSVTAHRKNCCVRQTADARCRCQRDFLIAPAKTFACQLHHCFAASNERQCFSVPSMGFCDGCQETAGFFRLAAKLMCFAQCCWINRYRIRVIFLNTLTSVFATVDMVLINISKATPTTSFRVSPTVSPVTAAL